MLTVAETLPVRTSQGMSEIHAVQHCMPFAAAGQLMTYTVERAYAHERGCTRVYLVKRSGSRQAWFMRLADDWSMDGKLAEQALLISLQGLANSSGPNLVFYLPG